MSGDNITGVGFEQSKAPIDQNSKVNANTVIGLNMAGNLLNMAGDGIKSILNYKLMDGMLGLQTAQMNRYYDLQGSLVGLNQNLIGSQEKIALKQLTITKDIAELQKDRDVAVAQTKANAAVKIAKVNALNAQFYGQPNQLPGWSS